MVGRGRFRPSQSEMGGDGSENGESDSYEEDTLLFNNKVFSMKNQDCGGKELLGPAEDITNAEEAIILPI